MKRNRSRAANFKLYTLNFGGNNIMKNTFAKNLVKSMENYGEMLEHIGC